MLVTLIFIVGYNIIMRNISNSENINYYGNLDEQIDYVEKDLQELDPLKESDKSQYIDYKSSLETYKLMKKYGVNRISIGVQSFDNDIIKLLGRRHTEKEVFDKINLIKRYIDNVNIDIIYAAYNDINILKRDIDKALKLDVKHISTYSLILEDNTLLKVNGFNGIDEDLDYEMYKYIEDILEDNGYVHYEISNYAKKGYESRHNLVYWNNDNYYGFGLSSTSYINGVRMVNTKNLAKYLDGEYMGSVEEESIDIRMENEVMLGLRKFNGINLNSFKNKYGVFIDEVFNIYDLINDGYLVLEDDCLKIDKKYMYISNEIIVRMFK